MSDADTTREGITETHTEAVPETPAGAVASDSTAARERPDLDAVQAKIDSAHEAEDNLVDVMPNATQPDDDAYEGMSGPTEGDVEETSEEQTEQPSGETPDDVADAGAGDPDTADEGTDRP